MPTTEPLKALLTAARTRLAAANSPTPRLDAEVLLAHCLGRGRSFLYTWPEYWLEATEHACFTALLTRREAGEPIAYLVGEREFWGLSLHVTPATLIPRPATELLVELALAKLPGNASSPLLELGTGSGAIALAIASERPLARIIAVEQDPAALQIARINRDRLGLLNVELRAGDWYSAVPGQRFELIVANPPYVAAADPHLAQGDLRYEPRAALCAGPDGLAALRVISAAAGRHLAPAGWLLVEHGHAQASAVQALLHAAGLTQLTTHPDLAGLPRCTIGQYNGNDTGTGDCQPVMPFHSSQGKD